MLQESLNKDNMTPVYVDGSCSYNGSINAIAGIGVWFGENHPLNTFKTLENDRITNITAETAAAIEACKICIRHGIQSVKIYTDSKYLIECMTKHISKWRNNGWINAKKKPVINQTLLRQLDQLSSQLTIEYVYTPGHQGIYGNERADELAKIGSKIYQ